MSKRTPASVASIARAPRHWRAWVARAGTLAGAVVLATGLLGVVGASAASAATTASKLVFTTEPPSSVGAGVDFTVAVSVEDSAGTVDTSSAAPVALSLVSPTTPGTLSCAGASDNTVDASSGVATFHCSVIPSGDGYSLTASSNGLTSASSTSFDVVSSEISFTTEGCSTWSPPVAGTYDVSTVGSAGQTGAYDNPGGAGDAVSAEVTATPSESFKVCVDFGGGAEGYSANEAPGGRGGGASSLFLASGTSYTPIMVAAGGGGGGSPYDSDVSGGGAYASGADDVGEDSGSGFNGAGGGGATNSSAGGGGQAGDDGGTSGTSGGKSSAGMPGSGGTGGNAPTDYYGNGGGGGAGFYGGGGGGGGENTGGGGGGGSDYCTDASAGTVTVSGCTTATGAGGSYGAAASGGSAEVSIVLAPSKLVITTPPPQGVGPAASFPVSVAVEDPLGIVVTPSTASVTLAITPSSGNLDCKTNPVKAVAGVASFSCSASPPGNYTLTASSTGLASATSSFTVVAQKLYAYADGGASAPTTCPQTNNAAEQCTLGGALGLAAGGDTVYLATPGATATYDGGFTTYAPDTSASEPLIIEPARGITNPTLDGQGKDTVLGIGSKVDVKLTGVTIEDGYAGYGSVGGGIYNAGELAVSDSTFSHNTTYTGETGTDGGAIFNAGTLSVSDSTFSDNSAQRGGAIFNAGTLSVSDSTFSDNTTQTYGGAIYNVSLASVSASTFSGGSGDSQLIFNFDADIWVAADIFDGSCATSTQDSAWNDEGYNVSTTTSCLSSPPAKSDVESSAAADLGPLEDNGGATDTMAPTTGNPAIAIIPNDTTVSLDHTSVKLCPATGQNGVTTTLGQACDAGAVQSVPPSPTPFTPAPALSGITPATGLTTGGIVVTLSGTDLCSPSAVDFGTVPGTAVSVNASCTTLSVTDPAHAAGTVTVTVTTPSGTSNGESFTYTTPPPVVKALVSPTLSGISPTSGSPSGGERVTLVGTNLCSPSAVDFGATPGTDISVNASCTTLSMTDPPGSGTVPVVVTTPSGSVSAPIEFTYIAPGYWMVTSNGSVYSFGGAKFYGSLPSIGVVPNAPIVAMADTPDHQGYWLFAADGGVFAFGDAKFYGSVPGVLGPEHRELNKPIVAAEAMPNGKGYRLFAADGGVFDFGDASFVGSLPCSAPGSPGGLCIIPNKPIESAVSDPLGEGYWLVGGDGGVFALGDAPFYGSLGAQAIPYRIVSMAATPDGGGYWVFGSTGSVDTYGDAVSYGSMLGKLPVTTAIAFGAPTTNGHGYWLFGEHGGVFAFGSAPFDGSLQSLGVSPSGPIVAGVGF